VIALEGEGSCFRNDIYAEYKANRDEAPADLKEQIPRIFALMEAMEMPMVSVPAYEADDVIGTIAAKVVDESDLNVRIFSSDKDLRQLINQAVVVLKPEKSAGFVKVLGESEVLDDMGIRPDQVVDYLALIGDSSDNIPGVKGVGPKTAAKLLAQYDSLEGIYKHIDEISSKSVKEKLIHDKDNAYLSRNLATIQCDLDIPIDLDAWSAKPLSLQKAADLLEYDSLSSVIQDANSYNKDQFNIDPVTSLGNVATDEQTGVEDGSSQLFLWIYEIEGLSEHVNAIKKCGHFCFDLETTGFDFLQDEIICMSIAYEDAAFVVPFSLSPFQEAELDVKIDKGLTAQLHSILEPLFADPHVVKIGQNIKFDIKFLQANNYQVHGPYFDTMLAEYCLDGAHTQLNMDSLAEKYLQYHTLKYKDIVPNPRKETLRDVPAEDLLRYSGQDAWITLRLYQVLHNKLAKNDTLKELFETIEIPLLAVLIDMESTGVRLERNYLEILSSSLSTDIQALYTQIMEIAGEEFNPNSPNNWHTCFLKNWVCHR
jgi:DNA polymerase-1